MGSKKKLFKKWFLRFKNQDLEAEFQSQRSKSSYNKFKRFNILVTSSHIVLLIILYFGGHLEGKEYRRNQEDSACKIRNEYRFLTVFPALIGVLQLDTILMKFKILQWMRGTLTLLTFFICTTEMSIHKFDNIKGMCIEFGQFTYLLMLTIYVGKEIIKYWERATITFILGVIYLYLRYINLDKAVYPQLILIVPILLLIMGFLYYNFEESERRLFYLMYEADKKEKEWSKLFNKMLVGLIIRNKQRKIKYTNRIAKQLIGEDVISNELGNRGEVLKNFIEEIDGKWKKRLRNADNIEHEICLSREGRIIYLEINKMSFELDNQKCRVYILKDMTLGKQVQIDMSKHAEEKDLFFASMSHDLRNPLNALLGSIDIFKISNYEYDQEIIETAQTCGETLLTIIGNILDVSKIENKKLDICPSGGNIVECVMKVALMMRSLAEKKSLFLKFKPELNMHKFYFFDHTRLTQVLINLIGNAIKFTDKGGIKIHLNWYPQQQLLTDDQISLNLEQIHQNDYQNFIETIVYGIYILYIYIYIFIHIYIYIIDGGNITEGIEDRNIMNEQTAEPVTMQDLNSRFSTEIIRPERKDENEEIMQQILEDNSEIEEECKILSKENILDQRGFIKIQITDSGIGISSSEIEKLFNPFSQAENSRRYYIYIYIYLFINI